MEGVISAAKRALDSAERAANHGDAVGIDVGLLGDPRDCGGNVVVLAAATRRPVAASGERTE
jgi:hypothetical protein